MSDLAIVDCELKTEEKEENYSIKKKTEDVPSSSNHEFQMDESLVSTFYKASVEPVIFLYLTSYYIGNITTENLNLEKACRVNLNFNESICDAMVKRDKTGYEEEDEIKVQKLVSSMLIYKTAIQGSLPFCLMAFFGSWSDRHGRRKPLIIVPIIGDIITSAGFLLCTYFFMELSVEYAIFFEAVPPSITGGSYCFFVGIFSYVAGKITTRTKTTKIGIAALSYSIATTIGTALGGITFKFVGFYGIYSTSLVLYLFAICYAIYFLDDKDDKYETIDESGNKSFFRDLFNVEHFVNSLSLCFNNGSDIRCKKLTLIMVLGVLILAAGKGEGSLMYMYTRRKFTWNEVNYGSFLTFYATFQIVGAFIGIVVFVKYFQLKDAMLGMIGMASKIIGSLIFAFAPHDEYFFLGALSELFNGNAHIAMRAIISKVVPASELGQVNSIFGMFESLTPLLGGPLYNFIYNRTIASFPGTYFLVSTFWYSIACLLFLWLFKISNSESEDRQPIVPRMVK